MRQGDTDENISPFGISALITSHICLDKLELRKNVSNKVVGLRRLFSCSARFPVFQ